jgi:putative DNA methylase
MTKETLDSARPTSFFASVTEENLAQEKKATEFVQKNFAAWQSEGLIPDMPIETGKENEGPIRTNGWTYWHHLFNQMQLIFFATLSKHVRKTSPTGFIDIARILDRSSKVNRWSSSNGSSGQPTNVFDTQALNTFFNYGAYASYNLLKLISKPKNFPISTRSIVECAPASALHSSNDIYVTDPPYADSVRYEEITEFFIAWLRKNPPPDFAGWTWDSRRALAITGDGEAFRKGMVDAYSVMANHMPDNGLQIVMFTHQGAGVWADMAQIFWGAGLQVMAAWYIATETTSELRKGGYVQGTVILALRKRKRDHSGYKDEIVQEVKAEVAEQIDTMTGLNQSLKGNGRIENLFEDADLQMAGYAAALRVLTKYERIDGTDMTKEALRSRRAGEKNLVGEIIDFAVQVANEHMVPEHMSPKLWEGLSGAERFYFKMMDHWCPNVNRIDSIGYRALARMFARECPERGLEG